MADNTTLNSGSGGDTIATEDRGAYKTPISLIDVGGRAGAEAVLGDMGVTLPANLRSEQVDDAAFTPATSRVLMVGAEFDNVATDSVDEGDGGALRMAANRCLYVNLRDNAGNERGLNVDASGNITVNITGTVTVGSHAVTNAGTFAVQVDGSALTALQLIDNLVLAEDAAHVTADPGVQMLAVRKATPANVSDTDGDYEPLQVSAGRLWTSSTIDAALPAGTNAIGKLAANSGVDIGDVDVTSVPTDPFGANADAASATGSISAKLRFIASTGIPITGTVTVGSHAVTNAGTFAVQAACTNAGTFAVQVDGAALTSLQLIDDVIFADDGNGFTPATSKVAAVGFLADETATDSVDEGDIGIARMTLDRKQLVVSQVHTAGGASIFRTLDLDETEEDVKTSAGQVYGYYVANLSAGIRYVKFYNATAANVTVGSTTPVLTLPIPAGASGHTNFPAGVAFDTAICVAATTGVADNDTGAPGANDVVLNVYYK